MATKGRRRWLSFGLRGLMLTITLTGLCLALWLQPYRLQAKAIVHFRALGARVQTRNSAPPFLRRWLGAELFQEVVDINFPTPDDSTFVRPIRDEDLVLLRHLRKLDSLKLSQCHITNEALTHLPRNGKLIVLYLDGTGITDAGLAHLSKLQEVGMLILDDCLIGDEGLAQLASTPDLQIASLDLAGTQVTDHGIAELRALPKLLFLTANRTAVTSRGLAIAATFSRLRNIDLVETQVTRTEIDRQSALHPRLKIEPTRETESMMAMSRALERWEEERRTSLRNTNEMP
jgi:hypothetical protein